MQRRATPEERPAPGGFSSRLSERAMERTQTLHRMRGGIMVAISLIAGAGVLTFAVWSVLLVTRNPAAPNVGILGFVIGLIMDVVVLFLAWMMLEALGRIERETDRVQQFMDNVYRRLP
jgi:xanthosine utilization system XapX-like protein